MNPDNRPEIVLATQFLEGNVPALRLLRVCAEFGTVTVITPQEGPERAGDTVFRRLVPAREPLWRGLRFLLRKLGSMLPERWRREWITGFAEEALAVRHQGANFKRVWRRHRLRPALLVLDGAEFMSTAVRLAVRAGTGIVYYVHEMFPNQRAHYTRRLTRYFCRLERRGCEAASHILVQHHLWGTLIRRRYRLPASKFTEVTPSPEVQEPLPGSAPHEPLRIYYHGLFTDGRGLEVVIRAVGMVPGVTLDLRGFGHYENELRRLAEESGGGDRIRFLPPLPTEELAASGRSYDLGVVTGTREHLNGRMGAGIKLYENVAAGIGLFGYRAVTLRHTARVHRLGFNYDGECVERTAEVLRHCLAHREEVAAARANAGAAARSYFNSSHQFDRLRRVIAAALEEAGRPATSAGGNESPGLQPDSPAQAAP